MYYNTSSAPNDISSTRLPFTYVLERSPSEPHSPWAGAWVVLAVEVDHSGAEILRDQRKESYGSPEDWVCVEAAERAAIGVLGGEPGDNGVMLGVS
jgi:hypothetical protein